MNNQNLPDIYNPELQELFESFKERLVEKHQKVSNKPTPSSKIESRPDGYDYVKDSYLQETFLKEYGPSSFEGQWEVIYAETPVTMKVERHIVIKEYKEVTPPLVREDGITVKEGVYAYVDKTRKVTDEVIHYIKSPVYILYGGSLTFLDNGLPIKEAGVGASRVQYKRNHQMLPQNIVDIDKQFKAARTQAKKDAMQRAGDVCADVYKRQMDQELTEATKERFLDLLANANEEITQRYTSRLERQGGIDMVSESQAAIWIEQLERKVKISENEEIT